MNNDVIQTETATPEKTTQPSIQKVCDAAKREYIISNLPIENKMSGWCKTAIVSLICGIITLCCGFYKMFCYDAGEVVNAYVGGDAYNYIINGTYATAYFVLTAMFVLASIGLVIIHYLSNNKTVKPKEVQLHGTTANENFMKKFLSVE